MVMRRLPTRKYLDVTKQKIRVQSNQQNTNNMVLESTSIVYKDRLVSSEMCLQLRHFRDWIRYPTRKRLGLKEGYPIPPVKHPFPYKTMAEVNQSLDVFSKQRTFVDWRMIPTK